MSPAAKGPEGFEELSGYPPTRGYGQPGHPSNPSADREIPGPGRYQLFDPLPAEQYEALKADIARRGVQVAVEVDENGALLDGYHRVRAVAELRDAGVAVPDYPTVVRASLDEHAKREHVLKLNLLRRQLGPVAWARAFARLAQLRGARLGEGRQKAKAATLAGLAAEVGVSARTARRRLSEANELENHPDLAEQVNAGELDARRAVAAARERARRTRREQLGAELAARPIADLDAIGNYGLIYADPPWRLHSNVSGCRALENHYPTMPVDDICALRPPAADDAVLFLWTISPLLFDAGRVIDAWGFTYRTCMVWVKDKIGMGYYTRQQHELLLIAKRGNVPTPPSTDRPSSVVHAPRGAHSAKPAIIYEIIERMFPDLPRLEMFCRARQRRPGWAAWGYEAPAADDDPDEAA